MADDPESSLPLAPAGPNVLLVVDDESLERFGAIPRHIVVGLADAAVRVTVLARTARPPSALELGPCVVAHDPPRWMEFRPSLPEAVQELVRDERIDAVHCLSVALLERMLGCSELGRIPFAAHITDADDLCRWETIAASRPLLWALPATPTLFKGVLDTKTVRSRYIRLVRLGVMGVPAGPILSKPDHIPSAMVVTPVSAECGLSKVLHAMHLVAAAKSEITLFVLGQGPAERGLRHLAQELGLQHTVVFVGALTQWSEALQGCDMLIVPRTPARWSSHVLEAMAAGRLVLAPRDMQEEDYLVDGQTACLFDPADPNDLADKWRKLITDRQAAQEIAAAARQFVKANNGPSVMATELIDFYSHAVAASA